MVGKEGSVGAAVGRAVAGVEEPAGAVVGEEVSVGAAVGLEVDPGETVFAPS